MLLTNSLTKNYSGPAGDEVVALNCVNLRVGRGEFVAVVGPSGSGKSSLLFALGGLATPSSGQVWLGDTCVYDLGPAERAALRRTEVGFVFQTFNLVPYLTCQENVALPALLVGRSRGDAFEAAGKMLDRLGLAMRARHRPGELSVGERQRAGIGRALVNGAGLLLADEPTGNLDPSATSQVMGLFRELNAGGQTIVMVTHDPRLAETADRVVRLRAGAVEEDGPTLRRERAS